VLTIYLFIYLYPAPFPKGHRGIDLTSVVETKDVLIELLHSVGYSILAITLARRPEVLISFQTGEEQLLWRIS
jgi:hypothetical protein